MLIVPISRAVRLTLALQTRQEFKDPSWNRVMVLQDQEKEWRFVKDAVMTSCVGAFLRE